MAVAEPTCAYCGSPIEPSEDQTSNFQGPVPCVACHKSTWLSIDGNGQVVDSQKWPID